MPAPEQFKPQDVPSKPGVYVFRNSAGDVIYVGKAKSLRKRLTTYFQPSRNRRADPKLRALINSIHEYEIHPVKSETEALLLESRLIKAYHPRYNVELRDDKRFLLIAVDASEKYPRLQLTRIKRQDGRRYYGPFPYARAVRNTVEIISKHFGLRTCSTRFPDASTYRHCRQRKVQACSCPCIEQISDEAYDQRLQAALQVLQGETDDILNDLQEQMQKHVQKQRFEEAARLRDVIANIKSLCTPQVRKFEKTTLQQTGDDPDHMVLELQRALELKHPPENVECFDISNISGRMAVGSMVCFKKGRPAKNAYRRFRIRDVSGMDDYAMLAEVVKRRYAGERKANRGKEMPDLIVVDGGPGQLSVVIKALVEADVQPMPVIGLAKQREKIYFPDQAEPLVLPREHEGLKLLQSLRDEAHRFAVNYHRQLRRKRLSESVLDEIEGVGPQRRQQLLRYFGSVKNLRNAQPEEIRKAVPGLGERLAERIHEYLSHHG